MNWVERFYELFDEGNAGVMRYSGFNIYVDKNEICEVSGECEYIDFLQKQETFFSWDIEYESHENLNKQLIRDFMAYLKDKLQDRPTANIFIDMYPYPCNEFNDIRTIHEVIGGYIIEVCGVQPDNITFRVYNSKYDTFRVYNEYESEQYDIEYDGSEDECEQRDNEIDDDKEFAEEANKTTKSEQHVQVTDEHNDEHKLETNDVSIKNIVCFFAQSHCI